MRVENYNPNKTKYETNFFMCDDGGWRTDKTYDIIVEFGKGSFKTPGPVQCYEEYWKTSDCTGASDGMYIYDFSQSQCISQKSIYNLESLTAFVTPTSKCSDDQCSDCQSYSDRNGDASGLWNLGQCYTCEFAEVQPCSFKRVECTEDRGNVSEVAEDGRPAESLEFIIVFVLLFLLGTLCCWRQCIVEYTGYDIGRVCRIFLCLPIGPLSVKTNNRSSENKSVVWDPQPPESESLPPDYEDLEPPPAYENIYRL